MKSHVELLGCVLQDCSIRCCTSTSRDFKTVTARTKHEGLSFLTITLPGFCSDFERCLDRGSVDPTLFSSFKKRASLPAFLQGLTSQVFSVTSGVLLDDPSIEAIRCIRQVCNLFKKLEVPCSDARISAAFDGYIECEQSIQDSEKTLELERKFDFMRISDLVFRRLFHSINSDVEEGLITPKHGPGATADRLKANAKYDNRLWTERLEEVFQAIDFLYTSPSHYLSALDLDRDRPCDLGPVWLEPGEEIPVRVITVPKTLKTPRIIAIEPTHMQYVQQGLMEKFVEGIERDDILSSFIGFTDQTVNRHLACEGSINGDLATLDLSEASDRVSNLHVNLLLGRNPFLAEGVQACRSLKADVPGHGIISLSKFASMGSALTFPMEAMVFLTIIFLGIERELNTPLTSKIIKDLRGQVRVYGDDIIVPVRFVHPVIRELEAFGLRVNGNKSFWTGKFRESCGGDFYDGFDVNTVKARHSFPTNRGHVQEIVSTVSLRNQLYFAGFERAAEHLDNVIERIIPFPRVHPDSPCLGKHVFPWEEISVEKMCPYLQRPLVKAAVLTTVLPHSPVSGHGALLKYFLRRGDTPSADKNHLERAGRPLVVNIKLRWAVPY
jgi:hypothetical protein